MSLTVTDTDLVRFYVERPHINFTSVVRTVTEVLRLSERDESVSGSQSYLLDTLADITKNIATIKSELADAKNATVANSDRVLLRLLEFKSDYIADFRQTINSTAYQSDKHNDAALEILHQKIASTISSALDNRPSDNIVHIVSAFKESLRDVAVTDESIDAKFRQFVADIRTPMSEQMANVNANISMMTNIITNNTAQAESLAKIDAVAKMISDMNNRSFSSQAIGCDSQNHLCRVLHGAFPSADIEDTTGRIGMGDFVMRRMGKPTVLFEDKRYVKSVPTAEVEKFLSDCKRNVCSGVFVSETSGISNQLDNQIAISDDGHIYVYLHKVNYDPDRLTMAVSIIDELEKCVSILRKNAPVGFVIGDDVLHAINADYLTYNIRRKAIVGQLKKVIHDIDDLQFPTLEKYMMGIFPESYPMITCDKCGEYARPCLAQISAHKKGCTGTKLSESSAAASQLAALRQSFCTPLPQSSPQSSPPSSQHGDELVTKRGRGRPRNPKV